MDQLAAWNAIGASFDATRQEPWPIVVDWLEALPPGQRVLDLMGGNGRHALVAQAMGHETVVADWSQALCARAPKHVVRADAVHLPLSDAAFDAVTYIAGLHGLPSAAQRQQSLEEMYRVMKPEAAALVTVWSRNAPRFDDVEGVGTADVVVPWRRDGHNVARTYHLYTPQALQEALEQAGFEVLDCHDGAIAGPSPDNVVAIVRKPDIP